MTDKRTRSLVFLVFIIANIILALSLYFYSQREYRSNFATATGIAERNGMRVQGELETSIRTAQLIGTTIQKMKSDNVPENRIMDTLGDYYETFKDSVKCVQYAPNGFIRDIYPEKGNEAAHINLFAEQDRKNAAVYGLEHGITTIEGPINLRQGGRGFVIRYPIFKEGKSATKENFVGFSTVLLDADVIAKQMDLLFLQAHDYDYYLMRDVMDGTHGNAPRQVFGTVDLTTESDVAIYKFTLPGYNFQLLLKPKAGWVNMERLGIIWLVAEAFILLLCKLFMTTQLLKKRQQELEELSIRDELTSLKNRLALRKETPQFLGKELTLTMFDVDKFKHINDTYGHRMGDLVLQKVGAVMKQAIPEQCSCYRMGGDEFLICDYSGNKEAARALPKLIAREIAGLQIADFQGQIRTSYGSAVGRVQNEAELQLLITQADKRLYRAKRLRKEQYKRKRPQ